MLRTENLFETSFRDAPIGMAVMSLDGAFLRVNAAFARMLQRSVSQLEGLSFADVTAPEDLESNARLAKALLEGRIESFHIEKRYLRADGTPIWTSLTASLVRDASRRPLHAIAQVVDIDAEKRRALDRQDLLNRTFVEATTELGHGITIYRDNRMQFVNDAYCQMLGYSREEIFAMADPLKVIAEDEREKLRDRLARRMRGEVVPNHYETSFRRKDGTSFPAEVSVARHVGPDGLEAVTLVKDISDRRRAEADAKRQLVARGLVRRVLRDVAGRPDSTATQRRELGRRLVAEATEAHTLAEMLEALEDMGVGSVRVVVALDHRYEFAGRDLLEAVPRQATPTCHLALGYLEGVAARLEGADTLGTETRCQSQGHAECTFVVRRRA